MTKLAKKSSLSMSKIVFGTLIGAGILLSLAHAKNEPLKTVEKIDVNKYLGTWYEIARKPMYFQNKCDRNVTAHYSLNTSGSIAVDNRCVAKDGTPRQAKGEAFVENAPLNSKLKVSFLPKAIRWLPVARGDYWILKIDDHYETVLVGGPNRKYMWLLSRSAHPQAEVVQEYLDYAQSVGYDLSDLIQTEQTQK